jgi:hypothetical protein
MKYRVKLVEQCSGGWRCEVRTFAGKAIFQKKWKNLDRVSAQKRGVDFALLQPDYEGVEVMTPVYINPVPREPPAKISR